MKRCLRLLSIVVVGLFVFSHVLVPLANAQAESTVVMTLADGTTISMTKDQLAALAVQPGVTVSTTATVTAAQMSVPIPASLGGGFIVAEPAALASALNATGLGTGLTATSFAGATAAGGSIAAGTAASAAIGAGLTAGTVGLIAAGAAAIAGGAAAVGGSGGGGGGGGGTTTTHTTTRH